jgi:hypothetical protein
MQKITGDKTMSNECFNGLIQNLQGFEMCICFGEEPSSAYDVIRRINFSTSISWRIAF